MNKLARCAFAGSLVLIASGCTAGYITDASGNAWNLQASTQVELRSDTNSYSAQGWTLGGDSVFSLDPNGPTSLQNSKVQVAPGLYRVYVAMNYGATVYSSYQLVNLGQYATCPYSDYFTGQSTSCQLLQLEIHPTTCFESLPKVHQNGNFLVVPIGTHSCD
jgi:hypothetical protein